MEKLYYEDPYLITFTARVVEAKELPAGSGVRLDRTAFYPAGGGQPDDRGEIAGVAVASVEEGPDGEVWHFLAGPAPGEKVEARIDWTRRFDLMQQHTGQHLLSAALLRAAGARTVGFHLTLENLTIDLDRPLEADDLDMAETLANRVIWEDRPVECCFLAAGEEGGIEWRKEPNRTGPIRLVSVADFDRSPCGGTHVRHTGEIGLLKVISLDRVRGGSRVGFLCGGRALADYRLKQAAVEALAGEFSAAPAELAAAARRLKERLAEMEKGLDSWRDSSLTAEAESLLGTGEAPVKRVFSERPLAEVRTLAGKLADRGAVALLAVESGGAAQLVLARQAGNGPDLAAALRPVLAEFGGKGGGTPVFAQGGVGAEHLSAVMARLEHELASS